VTQKLLLASIGLNILLLGGWLYLSLPPLTSLFEEFRDFGNASQQYAPDNISTGDSPTIGLVLTAWGKGDSVAGRYTNVILDYKMSEEADFKRINSVKVPFQSYLKQKVADPQQWEGYEFTLPPITAQGSSTLIYNIHLELDGLPMTLNGVKTININAP
jgi:hypothetical protein